MKYTIRTYAELHKWVDAFAKGDWGLFLLIGPQGLQKTTALRAALDKGNKQGGNLPPWKSPLWYEGGTVTAFQLYCDIWNNRGRTFVMDDIDSVYGDRQLVRLLKSLCQTEKIKHVGWHSANKQLDASGIPRKFTTTSRLCIIANEWQTFSQHVGSFVDRGKMVHFQPDAREVWKRAQSFFGDKAILKFVESHLYLVDTLSLRIFGHAAELKKAGLDWKRAVMEEMGILQLKLVEGLLTNKKFATQEERVSVFMKETGESRPMFFRYKDMLALAEKGRRKGSGRPQKAAR